MTKKKLQHKGTCVCYLRKLKLLSWGYEKNPFCNFRTFVIWKLVLFYRGKKHHLHLVVTQNFLDVFLPPSSKRSDSQLKVSYTFKGFWNMT